MAAGFIPDTSDFDEFIALAGAQDWTELAALARSTEATEAGTHAFFKEWLPVSRAHSKALTATAVWRWFDAQPNFSRALRASGFSPSMSATTFASENDYLDSLVRRALRAFACPSDDELQKEYHLQQRWRASEPAEDFTFWAERRCSPDSRLHSFRYHVDRFASRHYPFSLHHGIAVALRKYFAGGTGDAAERNDALGRLQNELSRVSSVLAGSLRDASAEIGSPHIDAQLNRSVLAIDRLQIAVRREKRSMLPSIRRDDTLPERVLMWDLSLVFRKNGYKNKTTALFYLLCLEGIRHPIDQRSVQRLLAKWRLESKGTGRFGHH
jgi:hypothetical protein